MRSSLSAKLRCTKVTASLCCPAVARKRIFRSRPLISSTAGSSRWSIALWSASPPIVGAIELLAVEQRDHRVFELHPRHFARERHVADRELVFAVCREIVFDDEAAARAERHPFDVMLLPAGAGSARRRQRNHHVGDVAVGGRLGRSLGVADRLERDRARGGDVLVDEIGRDLQGGGVVIEVALDVVVRQQRLRVDIEPEQIADGVARTPGG